MNYEKLFRQGFLAIILCMVAASSGHAYTFRLTPYIPKENPSGTAVIVCPGGSYFWLDRNNEGVNVARWLNDNNIAAFVLEYTIGGWPAYASHIRLGGRKYPAPLNDLNAALDIVRSNADKYGIRRDRIGCMGFSAGGHLAMMGAKRQSRTGTPIAFAALIYPVVTMSEPCMHKRSVRGLLGEYPTKILRDSMSMEKNIPDNCPPIFLINCKDDKVVNSHNSVLLDSALTRNNVQHFFKQYPEGGHGFGVSRPRAPKETMQWKEHFILWLKELFN